MMVDDRVEQRFLEYLPVIDRISASLCRRGRMTAADADDFASHVRARFVTSGYAPLLQHRGESSMATYLTVVIASWFKDQLVERYGRWRPSAVALRAGPVAVQLERLISKERVTAGVAISTVLAGGDQPYTEPELRALVRALPLRDPLRPRLVAAESVSEMHTSEGMTADARITQDEHSRAMANARKVLAEAMAVLSDEDRLLVSMRFLDGHSVADIARALHIDQRPLYRRLERAMTRLRGELEYGGLEAADVREVLWDGDC